MSPPIVDGSEMVNDFATGIYDVERFEPGAYPGGVYTPAGSTILHVKALVMPAGGQELLRLPEGDRTTESFTVLSVTELKTNETISQADRITIPPRGVFEVRVVEDWTAAGGFYKYLVQRVDLGD